MPDLGRLERKIFDYVVAHAPRPWIPNVDDEDPRESNVALGRLEMDRLIAMDRVGYRLTTLGARVAVRLGD
jgi:hypothetical protein